MGLQQRRLLRRLSRLRDQRRLVVVVIKKQPGQLYGAVGTAAQLGIMRELVKKISRYLLNQIVARRT